MGDIIIGLILITGIMFLLNPESGDTTQDMDVVIEPGDIIIMPFGGIYAIIEDGDNLNIV